jgi:hypothetical protein
MYFAPEEGRGHGAIRTDHEEHDYIYCRYLAHEEDGVEDNEKHDEILEGWGGDKPPDVESNPGLALWHINLQGLRLDHVGDAGFLHIYEKSTNKLFRT